MINVTINIESVFAQFATAKELKEVAQSVVNQVNVAYKARLAELKAETAGDEPVKIPVSVSGNETKTAKQLKQPKEETPKAKESAKKTGKTESKKAESKKTESKKKREVVPQVSVSSLTKAQIKEMDIKFVQYSEKCMFLTGNTRCIKDEIKEKCGGIWNGSRQGWFIKNDAAKQLAKALKIKIA